jgi:hypothetical protein
MKPWVLLKQAWVQTAGLIQWALLLLLLISS